MSDGTDSCSHAIVSSLVGPEYYVNIMSFVDKTQLEPGCSILLHNKVSFLFICGPCYGAEYIVGCCSMIDFIAEVCGLVVRSAYVCYESLQCS